MTRTVYLIKIVLILHLVYSFVHLLYQLYSEKAYTFVNKNILNQDFQPFLRSLKRNKNSYDVFQQE